METTPFTIATSNTSWSDYNQAMKDLHDKKLQNFEERNQRGYQKMEQSPTFMHQQYQHNKNVYPTKRNLQI